MSFRCFFGRHRPMLTSIPKHPGGFSALCDDCDLPIERSEIGRWTLPEAFAFRPDQSA
jgi:hypothetical protein